MCEAKPGKRCTAHAEPVAVTALGYYRDEYPDGPGVDAAAAAQAMFVPVAGEREVMVLDPDDEWGVPLYEGPASRAGDVLAEGEYKAILADADQRHTQTLAVRVPANAARPGDRVEHPKFGLGTVRDVSAEFASGTAVQVELDDPSKSWCSNVPSWVDPATLVRAPLSREGLVRAAPQWAPKVTVDARTFPDVEPEGDQPVYWVTGADLQRLHREARLGSQEEYIDGLNHSYLRFSKGVPIRCERTDDGTETSSPLETRDFEGQTLYSLRHYAMSV